MLLKHSSNHLSLAQNSPETLPFGTKIIVLCAIPPSLLLGRKTITNLDSILKKQRHHFSDKDLYSRSYGFSRSHIQIWELDHKECWAQRIDAFKLWCWECGAWESLGLQRRSNQSILKEISPESSLEGLMLKLKLQYCGHLIRRADSLGKTLMLGKIEGRRRRGWQNMRWLNSITDSMDMYLSKL